MRLEDRARLRRRERTLVLNVAASFDRVFTLQEVWVGVGRGMRPSYNTVGIVLRDLADEGLLRKLPKTDGDGNQAHYEWIDE